MYYHVHACTVCSNLIGQASSGSIVSDFSSVNVTDPGESRSFLAIIHVLYVYTSVSII